MQHITNLKEIEQLEKESKGNAEITDIKEYKKKMLKKQIEENLVKSEEDIEHGRVIEASKVFEEWNEKYGI